MPVNIRIPTPLRPYAGDRSALDISAPDVGAALEQVFSECPLLRPYLVGEDGALRNFVNVFVNGEDIRHLQGPSTKLVDGDALAIVPAIAGGAERPA